MFILKFRDLECWIAPWAGDPGRTLLRESAKQFKTQEQAMRFAIKAVKDYPYRKMFLDVEEYE